MNEQEWRLPTINELSSLLWGDHPIYGGYCEENIPAKTDYYNTFGRAYSCRCWSSSFNNTYGLPWYVHFGIGNINYTNKNYSFRVRLVRGNMTNDSTASGGSWVEGDAPEDRYSVSADEVVDNKTGLVWKKHIEDGWFTWEEALALLPSQ